MSHSISKADASETGKDVPFPRQCPKCLKRKVLPQIAPYTAEVNHDGRLHAVEIPELDIPTCRACGEKVFTIGVDDQISDALRRQLQLLTPAQISNSIKTLGLQLSDLAERLGVAEATLSQWVDGTRTQPRAMDNLLRVYFAFPELRSALVGPEQDPALGTTVRQGHNPAV